MGKKNLLITLPFLITVLLVCAGMSGAEEELIIVRYGKVSIKSSLPDAKIYIDDIYKGPADNVIENIMVGDHVISCRVDAQAVTGKFTVKRDETLKLEARFEERKLVPLVEPERHEKAEAEKKPKAEVVHAPKPVEKPKKAVVEAKREEKKNPVEERREQHLNMIKVYFEDLDSEDVRITHKTSSKSVNKFAEKKNKSGTYYRTKKNILLCDAGPCEQQWSASFQYTDDKGAADSFGLTWKQTVFNGITPTGTSKRELLYCLNNACKSLEDTESADTVLTGDMGRYRVFWSKSSLVIRRTDIMKEVTDSGGVVEAY